MIGEYRFFQEFFDGQIVQTESDNYKFFKVMLWAVCSAFGLFFVFIDYCNVAEFLLLELGLIWNIISGLDKKVSIGLGVCVGLIYFFFASNFGLYSNGLVYIACYIPLQLIATTKDYSEGNFIQIRKSITEANRILFFIFFICLFIFFTLFDTGFGANFMIFDSLSAALLLCAAVLRNERYVEYYVFRIAALLASILLWILVFMEYGSTGSLLIIVMYAAYLIFDVVTYFVQHLTYVNEYMLQVEKHEKLEQQLLVQEKLKEYENSKKSKTTVKTQPKSTEKTTTKTQPKTKRQTKKA